MVQFNFQSNVSVKKYKSLKILQKISEADTFYYRLPL